jgi:uncharacterized protein YpmB
MAPVKVSTLIISVLCYCLYLSVFVAPESEADPYSEQDSDGVPLAHLMAKTAFAKRTRQAILETNEVEMAELTEKEAFVVVLYQDDSKVIRKLSGQGILKLDSVDSVDILLLKLDSVDTLTTYTGFIDSLKPLNPLNPKKCSPVQQK